MSSRTHRRCCATLVGYIADKDPRELPIPKVCYLMCGIMGIFFLVVTLIDQTESGSVDYGRGRTG